MTATPTPTTWRELASRTLTVRTLEHQRLEAQGAPCTARHYDPEHPVNFALSNVCATGEHELCVGGRRNPAASLGWRCRCLCHYARELAPPQLVLTAAPAAEPVSAAGQSVRPMFSPPVGRRECHHCGLIRREHSGAPSWYCPEWALREAWGK